VISTNASVGTSVTLLGEYWPSIAQVVSETTEGYLERATTAKDSEVKAWMQSDGLISTPITIMSSSVDHRARADVLERRMQSSRTRVDGSESCGLIMDDLRPDRSSATLATATSTDLASLCNGLSPRSHD
jgi:hypothetical protein